jgi:hypothetical protein
VTRVEWISDGIKTPQWTLRVSSPVAGTFPINEAPIYLGSGRWAVQAQLPIDLPVGCDYQITISELSTGVSQNSPTFCMEDRPHLEIASQPGRVELKWPMQFQSYSLYVTTNLNRPFAPVASGIYTNGGYLRFSQFTRISGYWILRRSN